MNLHGEIDTMVYDTFSFASKNRLKELLKSALAANDCAAVDKIVFSAMLEESDIQRCLDTAVLKRNWEMATVLCQKHTADMLSPLLVDAVRNGEIQGFDALLSHCFAPDIEDLIACLENGAADLGSVTASFFNLNFQDDTTAETIQLLRNRLTVLNLTEALQDVDKDDQLQSRRKI